MGVVELRRKERKLFSEVNWFIATWWLFTKDSGIWGWFRLFRAVVLVIVLYFLCTLEKNKIMNVSLWARNLTRGIKTFVTSQKITVSLTIWGEQILIFFLTNLLLYFE